MPDVGGIAVERLKSFIERIERLEEERRALSCDIKEVYAEAKGTGFEPKIMRQIIKIRRMDKEEVDEEESLLDLYKRALGMTPERGMTDSHNSRIAVSTRSCGINPPQLSSARIPLKPISACRAPNFSAIASGLPTRALVRTAFS